ncbi:hypothetical protein GC105_14940 [Alkalibaculum sp. M08DMB]|uniref:DUF5316 domain-containing protein n=1 Tax=Alkalibaculum sporogenes TaxID=2655001 RepID=A0A6A7KCF5_9FIRM|nr:hypothetical protein [Alkalibaculum sporogenes]MPW27076.1 hypothetical protein [Alkalibaculum sporogenes]
MRKIFFIGVAAQLIIVIISLVLKDYQIIKNGNLALLGITILLAGAKAKGAAGWEYVGLKEEGKKELHSYRLKIGFKYLLFILPSLIVMLIYYIVYDFGLS